MEIDTVLYYGVTGARFLGLLSQDYGLIIMNKSPSQQKAESDLLLVIKEEDILVAPESKVDIHIGVINQSGNEDYFDILVNGVPSDWITIDTPVVHLTAGEAKQVVLTVQTPALLQSRVGQYPLDVRAVSQSDPQHSAVVHSTLNGGGVSVRRAHWSRIRLDLFLRCSRLQCYEFRFFCKIMD